MRQREIFIGACELEDPVARASFLTDACQGDAALQWEVEQLLQERERLDSFLEPETTAPFADYAQMQLGSMVGPYKLRELLGEGGFGVVYVAEQERPVRREVALKLIKPGMDSREVIARFQAERQALALMDHPNVARVLDAGTADDGRPYFVMELVEGIPVTQFCDKEQLSIRDRLELMNVICCAVQHAHQKGIIHRDIKPSNILIALHDGRPVPKVIDFGVSKALNQQLSENSVYALMGQMVGTPLYMSPEQAELSGLDVDTRSDVYSLGVVLYELLTGSTPFDREKLKRVGFDEIRRIICEDTPLVPSSRIQTLNNEHATTVASRRKLTGKQLSISMRKELDWIAM